MDPAFALVAPLSDARALGKWTGRGTDFTLLQARPVTMGAVRETDDRRDWYL